MAMTFTSDFEMLLNKPIDTKYVCDSLEELLTRLGSYLYVGLLTYCKSDNKYYSLKEITSDGFVWEELKGSGGGGGIGIPVLTQSMYEESSVKPDEYVAIDDFHNGVINNNTYVTSGNGTYIDVLFSAVRALQSEVARLKNSFYYGIQSYTGTDTASANIIQNETEEEKEPLWAIDPEDLSEFTDNSIIIGPDCLLKPVQNLTIQSNYVEIFDTVSQNVGLSFDISNEAKQCVYIIANIKQNATISLNLGGDNTLSLPLLHYLNRSKCNILLIISRKIYNEDTEQYFGKNYIWIQVTDTFGNVINTGYIHNNTLHTTEVDCGNRYYIENVNFSNIDLYKCNFYSKHSSFTNDDTLSSITPNEDFTYKAAHITIRSVNNKDTLLKIKDRLLENELVLVESEKQLYIKNKYLLISLSSGTTTDNETMTSEEILNILKEAGYITTQGELDSATLNSIEKLTFIHSESGNQFNMSINSDGNLIIDLNINIQPDTWVLEKDNEVEYTKRGAVGHYTLKDNFEKTVTEAATAIYGNSTDPKAYGDRVRFGSWYIPIKGQTTFGCSHDFIELANSGSVNYPLEGARLYLIKGDITEEVVGSTKSNYLTNASVHKFTLTGEIKSGSTYLIRGLKHEGKLFVVNVDSYDYELRDNKQLFSLEGVVGMILLNASNSPDIAISVNGNHLANGSPIYYLTTSLTSKSDKGSFKTEVRSDLIDCVGLGNPEIFRVLVAGDKTGSVNNLGEKSYNLKENHIVKDFFELDPSRLGFLSMTTSDFESTGYRFNKINAEYLDLANHTISFTHSDEEAEINRFTPKASYENKTICTDKTPLDLNKPNMVSCFPGINMQTTRCFNWISVPDLNEYVWIRKKGETDWSRFESYKSDVSEISNINDSYETGKMNRVKYTKTVINSVYKRMKGIFPGSNYRYTAHKCVIYILAAPLNNPVTYEYVVGATLNNGLPNTNSCSNIQTFTLYPNSWTPKVYLVSDLQGFEWTEYQVWAAAAKQILKQINEECTETTKKFPVLINSGDCTQNGTRYNEWLDYYNAGYCLFDHLELMNVVGNNDLANAYDHSVLGTGNDEGKSNPYYFHLVNCYELDNSENYTHGEDSSVYDKMWQHPLIVNGVYFPSTYYTYFGNFGYLLLNSELTVDMCKGLFKAVTEEKTTYNLYTSYLEGGTSITNANYCFKNTISSMLDKLSEKRVIATCHEMPFTVITNDNLSGDKYKLDRNCNGSTTEGVKHTSLVGSHMNRIHWGTNWNNDEMSWFSLLLQDKGVKLCLGGHKHSYTCTYPIYESPLEIAQLLSNVEPFKNYDKSKLFVTICDDSNTLKDALGVGDLYLYLPVTSVYHLLRSKNATYANKAVTYFMVQATGYKLKSNKELPSIYLSFSKVRPNTDVVNSKPHYSQESPMFATVDFVSGVDNYWGISLYRIINIKTTAATKVTEFSSKAYSTKPMVTERLILHYNNNDKVNDNYWYTKDSTDSYSFDYANVNSDRCWNMQDNKVSIKGGTIDYTDYTLNVKL